MLRFSKRAWGWYLVLLNAKRFKVKLLRFYRGKSCSNQYHNYRNELWLFLSGYGDMRDGTRKHDYEVKGGDWALVKKGKIHMFGAHMPTWILEVQYGDKCEEGDIIRL